MLWSIVLGWSYDPIFVKAWNGLYTVKILKMSGKLKNN